MAPSDASIEHPKPRKLARVSKIVKMVGIWGLVPIMATLSVLIFPSLQSCITDDDCSLNGVCGKLYTCHCDPGWTGSDCGVLDLRAAKRPSGYNYTDKGTSSWGSTIIRDPKDHSLYHLFAAEFTHGCGLDYWAPYSRIIRAESRTGPAGPYTFAAEVQGTFSHNPTVVYSPADEAWLMYYIGCPTEVADKCTAKAFTCGPGNTNNGESGISVMISRDLRHWEGKGQVISGDDGKGWDADLTNPSPFPLHSAATSCSKPGHGDDTPAMLLAYRGCPYNCSAGIEQINLAVSEKGYAGPYRKIQNGPVFPESNEDPFVWRDKRGHYHMLLHSLEPEGGFGDGPKVGRHAWAREYTGPWTFGNRSLAFSTAVEYGDGSKIDFYRRERPQLYFSNDGKMTPLFMTTGVQPRNNPMSYTVIVPIGDNGVALQG